MEQIVKDFIKEIGFENVDNEKQENRVNNWLKWYNDKPKEYTYYVYNGKSRRKQQLKTLSIIPQSCEDISDFFFNEKLSINISEENIQKQIDEIFKTNKFLYNANKLMQLTKALGTGAFIPYLDNDVVKINFIDATGIVILEADSSGVKSVLFWNKDNKGLKINAHVLKDNGYTIYNKEYKLSGGSYVEVELEDELAKKETGSFIPQFSIIFNTPVNNSDINSPYGISMYANALDNVLSIDTAYDSLNNEISGGKKRIYIKGGAVQFNVDADGNATPIFDETETQYYVVPGSENDKMITESNGELRIDAITNALQSQLNLYTSKVGLGHNYYKFKDGEVYVNTDNVMSSNSDVYRKIKKQENILTYALTDLVYAIAYLLNVDKKFSVSVDYDDSIIEDTEAIRREATQEYNTGLISKQEYYRRVNKMDDKNAKDYYDKIVEEQKIEKETDGQEFAFEE